MSWLRGLLGVAALVGRSPWAGTRSPPAGGDGRRAVEGRPAGDTPALKGWKKGKGWGWVWGKDDEVGALNAMTPETRQGRPRRSSSRARSTTWASPTTAESFKWPGHSPGEIITFRSPEGVKRQGDFKPAADPKLNPQQGRLAQLRPVHQRQRRHADRRPGPHHRRRRQPLVQRLQGGRLGRQLRHPQVRRHDHPADHHPRRAASTSPALRKVDALPPHYRDHRRGPARRALEQQKTKLQPGDIVLIRTGTLRLLGRGRRRPRRRSASTTRPASTWRRPSGWSSSRGPS